MEEQIRIDIGRLENLVNQITKSAYKPRRCVRLLNELRVEFLRFRSKDYKDNCGENAHTFMKRFLNPALVELVKPGHAVSVRAEAVEMLGVFAAGEQAVKLVFDALYDPEARVREAAVNSLFWQPSLPKKVIRRLIRLLGDPSEDVGFSASGTVDLISKESAECRKMLVDFLKGPLPENRRAIWNALMALDLSFEDFPPNEQRTCVDALLSLLMRLPDNKAGACWKVGDTLGDDIGGALAFDALVAALRSPHAYGRWSAVHGLSHLENADAIPYLEEVARHDSHPTIRKFAREVVRFLSGEKGCRVYWPPPSKD
ncbi:MAG: HEAT repeat domain-containing protein [Armatimonadota bacterium]